MIGTERILTQTENKSINSLVFSDANDSGAVMTSRSLNDRSWCIAKENANPNSLQTAIDWVCGSGCIDCGPIQTRK